MYIAVVQYSTYCTHWSSVVIYQVDTNYVCKYWYDRPPPIYNNYNYVKKEGKKRKKKEKKRKKGRYVYSSRVECKYVQYIWCGYYMYY